MIEKFQQKYEQIADVILYHHAKVEMQERSEISYQ
jgi:hypothetical protein